MAHNLEIKNGEASFFSVKEKAWHGLGTIVEGCPNVQQAVELSKTNWYCEKENLLLADGRIVPDKYAVVRQDTKDILGVVGSKYEIVNNKTAFSFFDFLDGECCFETGGVLGKGEVVFLSAKLPSHFTVAGNSDLVENYLLLTTSHNGTLALSAMFTPVRVVCNNTLNGALRDNQNKIHVRHTISAEAKIKQANQLMGIVNKLQAEMEVVYKAMYATKVVSDSKVQELILNVIAPKFEQGGAEDLKTKTNNRLEDIFAYYEGHETQKGINGTVWGVYNALTGFYQNASKHDDERKLGGILKGDAFLKSAFDVCKLQAI